MKKKVEFYFDFGSAPSYLAHTQLPAVMERAKAEVEYRPVLLGGIFKKTGNRPPGVIPEKLTWFKEDMTLFARKYDVPFSFPVVPITNTIQLLRGALVAKEMGCFAAYCDLIFQAIWADGQNVQEEAVWVKVLDTGDLDSKTFIEKIRSQKIKDQLIALTRQAAKRGVFGAPTFFVGDKLFFGQDRLDFVESALRD